MPSSAIIIQQPAVDFGQFLAVTREMLGRSVSAGVDASPKQMEEAERFLGCLAEMAGPKSSGDITPNLQEHAFYSVLFAVDDYNLLPTLEVFSGMPFVITRTEVQSIVIGVVSGTLGRWRDTVASGNSQGRTAEVRTLFNKIMVCFEQRGLGRIWGDYSKHQAANTGNSSARPFYLEHRR